MATSPFDKTQNIASPGFANWPSAKMELPKQQQSGVSGAAPSPFVASATTAPVIPSATTAPIVPSATTPGVPPSATTPMVVPSTLTAKTKTTNTALSTTVGTAMEQTPVKTTVRTSMTSPGQVSVLGASTTLPLASTQSTNMTSIHASQMNTAMDESEFAMDLEGDLYLSQEHMETIKSDFIMQRKVEGKLMSAADVKAFTVVEDHREKLQENLKECGHYLDLMIGKRCIYVQEALKALEQVVSLGVISAEEVVLSRDVEKLNTAAGTDVVTIHSLANIVRKILNNRMKAAA